MAKVLYADDNHNLRDSFCRILPRLGHEVVAVDDAARAWEMLDRGDKFDAILSDFEMPEMDGLTFMRKVRGDPRFKEMPFAMMSGHDDLGGRPLGEICKEANSVFFSKLKASARDVIDPWLKSLQSV